MMSKNTKKNFCGLHPKTSSVLCRQHSHVMVTWWFHSKLISHLYLLLIRNAIFAQFRNFIHSLSRQQQSVAVPSQKQDDWVAWTNESWKWKLERVGKESKRKKLRFRRLEKKAITLRMSTSKTSPRLLFYVANPGSMKRHNPLRLMMGCR